MNKIYTLSDAKKVLDKNKISCIINGDKNSSFSGFASISDALPSNAVMLREKSVKSKTKEIINELNNKTVAAIITTEKLSRLLNKNIPMIITKDPRLAFSYLAIEGQTKKNSIDTSAIIFECVSLANNVSIGPYAVLGSSGLSPNYHGNKVVNTPHLGGVTVASNVTIGANSIIVRAVMGSTHIGEYSTLAHGVSIGHGCKIGKRVMIAPGSVISGSCKIGDGVWIGPNVSIRENISIGSGSFIGIGSVVTRDIDQNQIIMGNPARSISRSKRPW